MNQQAFIKLLAEANKLASVASQTKSTVDLRGNCVIVTGLPLPLQNVAIRLGAEKVDAGLLFAPAEAYVPNTSAIRHKCEWAHEFQRVLKDHGLDAYVMQKKEQYTN